MVAEKFSIKKLALFLMILITIIGKIQAQIEDTNIESDIYIIIEGNNLKILSDEFNEIPTEVFINGDKAIIKNNEILIQENLETEINIITIRWNYSISDCSYMFYNLTNIINIDFSNFDLSNVVNTIMMFGNCEKLSSIIFPYNTNISSIQNMNKMFYNCISLNSLDLSSFQLLNVINMESMFYNCISLISLDLSNLQILSVQNMESMFYECHNLKYLNLDNINTINVKNMSSMFYGCKSLLSLNLSNFDTSNVLDMEYMFYKCESLVVL